MKKNYLLAAALASALLLALPAQAATSKATRIVNDLYRFAFTVQSNSEISYQDGGVGLMAKHVPDGAAEGDPADYGLLVYGSPRMHLSPAEAEAAGFKREELLLLPGDVGGQAKLNQIFSASMGLKEHQPSGQATVKLPGEGKSTSVTYFKWSQKVGGQTAYALMYLVLHTDGFIYVQAESRQPFSAAQEKWFTSKLELLEVKAPAASKPAAKPVAKPKPRG